MKRFAVYFSETKFFLLHVKKESQNECNGNDQIGVCEDSFSKVSLTGQQSQLKLIDAQRWKRVWVDDECNQDSQTENDCNPTNVDNLCWFLLEKVTDGRDTDGQFLKAISRTETTLSGKYQSDQIGCIS